MNIVGKILVFVVFLAALAIGAFTAFNFVTSTNWAKQNKELMRELEVSRTGAKTLKDTNGKLAEQLRNSTKALDAERTRVLEDKANFNADLTIEKSKTEDAMLKVKEAELNLAAAIAQQERLKEEVKGLLTTLAKREDYILKVEDEAKRAKINEVTYKNERDTVQARNESLFGQVQRLQKQIAEMQNTGVSGATLVRDPSAPNPPPSYVKGVIEKVDPVDRALVEISLGTDHGVNKTHTLEVYRTSPRPEYLGTIRIIDSFAHKSVGKLVRPNLQRTPLQSGDIVASSLANP